MEVISAAFDDGENKRHLMSMRRKARKAVDRLLYPPTVDLLLLVLLLLLSFFSCFFPCRWDLMLL
jgi:hypothetical protein